MEQMKQAARAFIAFSPVGDALNEIALQFLPVHEEGHRLAGGHGLVVRNHARVGVLVVALDHALFVDRRAST